MKRRTHVPTTPTTALTTPGMRTYVRRRATVQARQIVNEGEARQAVLFDHGDIPKVGDWLIEAAGHTWVVERDAFDALYELVK